MKLLKTDKSEYSSVYDELKLSFPENELPEKGVFLSRAENDSFSPYYIICDGERVGIITLWDFGSFAYAEHFAIKSDVRSRGIGGETIERVKKAYPSIVLEAELPTEEIKARRVEFYKRHGFKINPLKYSQPPYREGDPPLDLLLLSFPDANANAETVKTIHKNVYGAKHSVS